MLDPLKLDQLTPRQKRELLADLMRNGAAIPRSTVRRPTIAADPAARHEPFPLTDVQRAYWLGRGTAFELGNVSCHMYLEFDVERLDRDRLRDAWRRLIDRHDMLRAVVQPDGRQRVLDVVPAYEIQHLDLRRVDDAEGAAQLTALRQRMSHQVLPSDRWPLFELRTSQRDERRTRVHVSFDLLIIDFWSIQILVKEWFQLYLDRTAPLAPLAISYRDYVMAVRQQRDPAAESRAQQYWAERLAELPPAPELPLAVSPSTVTYPRFVRRQAVLETAAWQSIKSEAARLGLTPSAVLLGAFSDVLATWSKSPRFTVNVTLFQRRPLHPQVRQLVGDFTSITLLELDRSTPEPFEAACRRIQTTLWRDLEHAHYSGVRVLQDLTRTRGHIAGAVMPVVFTSALALDTSATDAPAGVLPNEMVYAVTQTPQVWLDHQIYEQGGRLHFSWDVVEELFPPGLMDDMFVAYRQRLATLAEQPSTWRAPPESLVPARDLALGATANDTAGPLPGGLLHHPFLEQARARPDHEAVVCGAHRLTYAHLSRLVHYWAGRLRETGARPNQLVAVVMEKGWEQVVAVLATLEAGATYLPLDPTLPSERLTYLLRHGEVEVVLTQAHLDRTLEWPAAVQRLRLDEVLDSDPWSDAAWPRQDPEDLAYVIYTSGSTGLPKGVMIDHRGALNTIDDINDRFGVGPEDRVLALSALSFDLSVWDIFGTLAAGATLIVPDARAQRDPAAWAALLREERVTIWNSVPALLDLAVGFAEAHHQRLGDGLRLALLSGDWIPVDLPSRCRALADRVEVVSLGGATEGSIWSILYPIGAVGADWKSVPYGQPMRNQTVYVLDEALQPRPVWVSGQLYIGGVGVARGYWRDEARTREQFIVHPVTGERLYRTGDLGRYLPDGNIELLGREDFQVKVNGFRIELGEIEAALARHPAVRAAVVTAIGARGEARRLAAYVVGEPFEPPRLQEHLRRLLPDYMVPGIWERLDALPLTANAKVDRASLPVPTSLRTPTTPAAPRNELEAALAEIWAAALHAESVGVEDNFFALGGDSLVAVQMLADIRERLHVEVPARLLFERSTVRELAAGIAELREHALPHVAPLVTIRPDPATWGEPFPLTDIQQAYWIGRGAGLELGNVAAHVYLEVDGGSVDAARLSRAWQRLIDRHGMLRAVVRPDGRQQILPTVPEYRIEDEDLTDWPVADVERHLDAIRQRMSHQIFRSGAWPMFELRVTSLPGGRHRLHVSIDLLIVDVWSFRLLVGEWLLLYQQPDTPLPELEISFSDYVRGLKALEETPAFRASLDYWMGRLESLPPGPELPLACNPADITRPRFVRRSGVLSPEQWNRFKAAAAAAALTPSAALMAAFADVLGAWSRSSHFTMNVTLFQRLQLHPQVSQIVGDFTSVTLLEVDLAEAADFTDRARRLQQRLWQDLDHRYVSGVRVLRELARRHTATDRVFMPVVFTSTLGQGIPGSDVSGAEALGELAYMISQTPQVWLDHQISEQRGALHFSWDTVDDLFPVGVLDDMFSTYCSHLDELARSTEAWRRTEGAPAPADHLERRARVNATEAELDPAGQRLHTLFARQAARRPADPAVVHAGGTMSYDELSRRAAGVSHLLRERGARPNQLVAVVMEKGWEQVVAVLGILGSGAAYLPIDASLPAERIQYLLRDGDVDSVLTQSWLDDQVAWPDGVRRTCVDRLAPADERLDALAAPQATSDLAYVIYTSGSTGAPKGVMIDHRGAVNTVLDINDRFGVGPEDRVLALSSLSFDLSVYDVFGVLAAGGALVMPPGGPTPDPSAWLRLCEAHRVTIWNSVPAMMQMAVDQARDRGARLPSCLRLVMLSGDWISVTLPDEIRRLADDARTVSLGGATEASIWSIAYPIGTVDPRWTSIPYGQPLANQSFHVLDGALEPRPDWVPGELYIGGRGLAQGYWRDPERTAARFVRHPRTGERLYRTGDLGRYLPDGNIEFLGREDTQVKVHGHRVELGEIEAALAQHPQVAAAVVIAAGEPRGARRLIAYVTAAPNTPAGEPGGRALRVYLETRLPAYMVPATYVHLEAMPLTANGKVDRRALPLGEATADPAAAYVAPRDALERGLVEVWQEVLGRPRIGVQDDFFELGGDSLRAIVLLARVRQLSGAAIPVATLLRARTVADLASLCRVHQGMVGGAVLVPIQPRGSEAPFFWAHPIGGNVLCYAALAQELGLERPFYGLQALGLDGAHAPLRSIEAMAAGYVEALREVQPHGPYVLGGWSMGGLIALEVAQQLGRAGEQVELLAVIDSTGTPGGAGPEDGIDDVPDLVELLGMDVAGLSAARALRARQELQAVPPAERARSIVESARAAGLLAADVEADQVQPLIDVFAANLEALQAYAARPYNGRVALFLPEQAPEAYRRSVQREWEAIALGGVEVHLVPGDHYTMLQRPRVGLIGHQLNSILRQARRVGPTAQPAESIP